MSSSDRPSPEHHEAFSLPLFFLTVAVTLAALFALVRFIAPAGWDAQLGAPISGALIAFLAVSLVNCFFEYFFHRYLLYTPAVPFLRRLYRQHTLHHALTRIAKEPGRKGRSIRFIENKFPIVEPEQGEASFFPWYSLATFAVILTPLFALLQWLVPSLPWFLSGYAALAVSITLYEVLHAINHWPFEQWQPLIEHPRFGWFWRPVYGFHLRHHAVADCNESIPSKAELTAVNMPCLGSLRGDRRWRARRLHRLRRQFRPRPAGSRTDGGEVARPRSFRPDGDQALSQ